jgi:hypothetical protein
LKVISAAAPVLWDPRFDHNLIGQHQICRIGISRHPLGRAIIYISVRNNTMKPDEIKLLIDSLIERKTKYYWIYLLIYFILVIASTYFLEFIKVKGQNYATKSDIEELTKKVEEVKSEYVKQIEIFKGNQRLKDTKKQELYAKVEELRVFILKAKNEKPFTRWEQLSQMMKDVMTIISSNIIFSELQSEAIVIETNHNNMVSKSKELKNVKSASFSVDLDPTVKALESIQAKLME